MSSIYQLFLCFLFLSSSLFSLEIIHFKGNVFVNSKKLTSNENGQLHKGDVVEAKGEGSVAVARYEDGSKVLVKNGQAILVEDGQVQRKWRLESGEIFVTVEKKKVKEDKKAEKNRFMVLTKSAVMGVRGTKFYVQEGKDDSYMCVCEGEVEVRNKHGVASVRKDSDIRLSKDTKNFKVNKAPDRMIKMAWNGLNRMDKVEKDFISKRSSSPKKGEASKKPGSDEEAQKGIKREELKGEKIDKKREGLKERIKNKTKDYQRSNDRGKVKDTKKRIQLSPDGKRANETNNKMREAKKRAKRKVKKAKRMREKAREILPQRKLPSTTERTKTAP